MTPERQALYLPASSLQVKVEPGSLLANVNRAVALRLFRLARPTIRVCGATVSRTTGGTLGGLATGGVVATVETVGVEVP